MKDIERDVKLRISFNMEIKKKEYAEKMARLR